jgi:hypothetical protein
MQWVCSLRDSLQGLDQLFASYPPYEPASHFPLGAGHKGHWEAPLLHLQLFKSSTRHPYVQPANRLVLSSFSRLPENNNQPGIAQPNSPVERRPVLWESPSSPRQFNPKRELQFPAGSPKSSGAPPYNRGSLRFRVGYENVHGRAITPRSVSPFTKSCIASATSNSPMILTRIRIPVSPMNALTRPAPASTK